MDILKRMRDAYLKGVPYQVEYADISELEELHALKLRMKNLEEILIEADCKAKQSGFKKSSTKSLLNKNVLDEIGFNNRLMN